MGGKGQNGMTAMPVKAYITKYALILFLAATGGWCLYDLYEGHRPTVCVYGMLASFLSWAVARYEGE